MQKIREEKCLNKFVPKEHAEELRIKRPVRSAAAELDDHTFVDCMSEKGKAAYMAHGRRKDEQPK